MEYVRAPLRALAESWGSRLKGARAGEWHAIRHITLALVLLFLPIDPSSLAKAQTPCPVSPLHLTGGAGSTQAVQVTKGAEHALCQALAKELAHVLPRIAMKDPQVCEAPLPENPDFRRPKWESLEPLAHLDVVEEIYFFSRSKVQEGNYSAKWRRSTTTHTELLEQEWAPAEQDMRKLIDTGAVKLERTRIDINHDGKNETVYRMTAVFRPYVKKGVRGPLQVVPCRSPFTGQTQQMFRLYVRQEDHPKIYFVFRRYTNRLYDVFWYKGRVYLANLRFDFSVQEPSSSVDGGILIPGSVCEFDITVEK